MARSNRSVVWVAARTLEIQERPIDPPGANDVLVQVISTGICGSDAHNWTSSSVSRHLVLGHESAGIIVEVGSDVKDRHVGQRVAVEPGFACLKCEFCLRGNPNTCANLKYCGMDPTDGTLRQYFTCGAHMAIPIPDEISWEEAGAIQPLAIAVQLARRANLTASKTLAIFGCGPLGLLVIAIAKAYGVRKIVVFDVEQSRLDFALSYGADIGILSPNISKSSDPLASAQDFTNNVLKSNSLNPAGIDISIEASGAESCAQMALTILKPGGTCIQAGLGKPLTAVPLFLLTARELNIRGTVRFTPGCYEEAIDLVSRKKVDLKSLVTGVYPLTKANEAFLAQGERKGIKIIIMNQE
ncbi:chaperonin 10-like protein [Aspergillus karnatakaensis]|uniref:NAD(P)-dependent alcohol dehydrogenase n=1 Tax=Aspergillus karnatakaensis TaxID=1810916 RepID=UPI003CCE178B